MRLSRFGQISISEFGKRFLEIWFAKSSDWLKPLQRSLFWCSGTGTIMSGRGRLVFWKAFIRRSPSGMCKSGINLYLKRWTALETVGLLYSQASINPSKMAMRFFENPVCFLQAWQVLPSGVIVFSQIPQTCSSLVAIFNWHLEQIQNPSVLQEMHLIGKMVSIIIFFSFCENLVIVDNNKNCLLFKNVLLFL